MLKCLFLIVEISLGYLESDFCLVGVLEGGPYDLWLGLPQSPHIGIHHLHSHPSQHIPTHTWLARIGGALVKHKHCVKQVIHGYLCHSI